MKVKVTRKPKAVVIANSIIVLLFLGLALGTMVLFHLDETEVKWFPLIGAVLTAFSLGWASRIVEFF